MRLALRTRAFEMSTPPGYNGLASPQNFASPAATCVFNLHSPPEIGRKRSARHQSSNHVIEENDEKVLMISNISDSSLEGQQ